MKNKETKKRFGQKFLCSILCAVIAMGCVLFVPQYGMKAEAHKCNYQWITLSEGSAYKDMYQIYSCQICGKVKMVNFMFANDYVRDRLQKQIKNAREDWVVVSELGFYHTIHDEVFVWLTERYDVTLMVTYEYDGTYYQTTFPAGADYSEFLQDDVLFYGLPGLNGRCGIVSMAGEKVGSDFPAICELVGTEEFYAHIDMAPQQATVYSSFGDCHTVNKTLFTKLTERNDVTAVVYYEYNGMNFKTTFPAGADYTEILTEGSQFFGMLGLNGRCGITTEIIF